MPWRVPSSACRNLRVAPPLTENHSEPTQSAGKFGVSNSSFLQRRQWLVAIRQHCCKAPKTTNIDHSEKESIAGLLRPRCPIRSSNLSTPVAVDNMQRHNINKKRTHRGFVVMLVWSSDDSIGTCETYRGGACDYNPGNCIWNDVGMDTDSDRAGVAFLYKAYRCRGIRRRISRAI